MMIGLMAMREITVIREDGVMRFKHKCPVCGKQHSDENAFNESELYDKECDECAQGGNEPVCGDCGTLGHETGDCDDEPQTETERLLGESAREIYR
jgi:hypothetical protein